MAGEQRDIVWIASYPKSGNTWVRFLACNLLYGPQQSASALNALAPDIHESGRQLVTAAYRGLVKTHFAYSPELPLAQRTAAAIQIVRDPADVLASNFHYARRRGDDLGDARTAFDRYVEAFILHRGDPRWIRFGMGTWEENVTSWLEARHKFPVLSLKYEDMAANPRQACRSLAQLLRPTASPDEIEQAIANSTFERMREVEDADIRDKRIGIFYKPYLQESIDSGLRFMRRGAPGEGAARLNPKQRAGMAAAFRPLLSQLGYSHY